MRENSATLLKIALDSVAVPVSASASEWFDLDDRPWRFVRGQERIVTEGADNQWSTGEVSVQAEGAQYENGALDDDDTDPPGVLVNIHTDDRLTPDQARRLAAELVNAANEVEGWGR